MSRVKNSLLLVLMLLIFLSVQSQVVFYEDFEGATFPSTQLPLDWNETGLSLDGVYSVGTSVEAGVLVGGVSKWVVPNHGKFVMTNDARCSFELGFGKCNKSLDRLILPSINLSTISGSLVLYFSSFFSGKLGSQATVEISIDGGLNWVVEHSIISNASNWLKSGVNLSQYIGQSNVIISFLYNDNDLVRDGFALDDVSIVVQKPWKDVMIDYVGSARYARVPLTQYDSVPLSIKFHNNGSLMLDTVMLSVTVYNKTTSIVEHKLLKQVYNVKPKDSLLVLLGSFLPVLKNQVYEISHSVYSRFDTIPSNDTIISNVRATVNEYGRDDGASGVLLDVISPNSISIGSVYRFNKKAYLDSLFVQVVYSDNTTGSNLQAFIYPVKDRIPSTSYIGLSSVFVLTDEFVGVRDLNFKLTNLLSNRLLLDTGDYLMVIKKLNGGKTAGINMSKNYYEDNSVYIQVGNVPFQTLDSYFLGTKKDVPIIRAYVNPFCHIKPVFTIQPSECFNSNGSLSVSFSDIRAPYQFEWSTKSSSFLVSGLKKGSYGLWVSDYEGCKFDTANIKLNDYQNPIIQIDTLSHPRCFNESNGGISLKVSGDFPISSIFWNNNLDKTLSKNDLFHGVYAIKVVNSKKCRDSIVLELTNPTKLNANVVLKNEKNGFDGAISVNVSGGITPYSFLWNDSVISQNRVNLKGDTTYECTILDANKCHYFFKEYIGSSVGIDLLAESNGIRVFPNPFKDNFIVTHVNSTDLIKLTDLSGAEISFRFNLYHEGGVSLYIDNHLVDGVYFLHVQTLNGPLTFKMIKS